MKKISINITIMIFFLLGWIVNASAHFGMIIPSDNLITQKHSKIIKLEVQFLHPMENSYMDMEKPVEFGVRISDKNINLLEAANDNYYVPYFPNLADERISPAFSKQLPETKMIELYNNLEGSEIE